MNTLTFISLLFTLQLFYWIIGRRASKNISTQKDYLLAGKTVRLFPLTMTFLATQVGGGMVLGAAEEAFQFGWPVILYPLGAGLGLVLLGSGIGRLLAQFQVSTIAEIFEVIYKSRSLRKVASVLSIATFFIILITQVIASKKFMLSLGFDNTPLFILFWAIVIIYTAQGGLKAVISTDVVQASFFSIVFVVCMGFIYFSVGTEISVPMPKLESFSLVSSKLSGWLFMPLLFMVIEQDMGQRCFAGISPKVVSRASLYAGIGTFTICIIPIFLGVLGKTMGLSVPPGVSVLMVVIEKTTTPFMAALIGCAVLAAVISTATSVISALCSNIASDFNLQKGEGFKKIQWLTCIISGGALGMSFMFNNIVDLLILSYELSVSTLFVPILLGLLRNSEKNPGNLRSAVLSITFGTAGFILFRIYKTSFPKEMLTILLSGCGYAIGELTTLRERSTYENA